MTTLEKIRAEIDVIEINGQVDEHTAFIRTGEHVKQMALDIIDKYAEQEPMREFTEEEAKAYSKALDKMYKPTGFNVFDEYGNYKYPSDVELTEPNTATSMPCDDVVSRQAVYEILDGNWNTDFLRAEVEKLPSVRPQEQTGHWIGVNPMVDTLICSECGENIISEEFKSNYCPNCGAKMVEQQESEDKE